MGDSTEVMEVLHGLELSVGSVSAAQRQVSEALAEPVAEAQQFVQQQRAQYMDIDILSIVKHICRRDTEM